jgi:AGZA family xanthine/uracil permease-like MFS transporter
VELIPLSVLAPILVFVAIGITVQAFEATPMRYAPAVVFSFFPAIARMVTIKLSDPTYVSPDHFALLYADRTHGFSELAITTVLGNGFIITSMVWASFVVALIDGKALRAGLILLLGAALSLFGVIHSVQLSGGIYLPWQLDAASRLLVWQFAGAYAVLAVVLVALSVSASSRPAETAPHHW